MPQIGGFPNIQGPLADLKTGRITQPWFQLLVDLWNAVFGNGAGFVPAGAIVLWGAAAVPAGYLECNGQAVSRTTYAAIFEQYGTTWGIGDGATTFNLPDFRDRFPVGRSGTIALAATGGAASVTISTANLPAHSHGVSDPGHTHIFTGAAHGHTFTGTSHGHTITDPGHIHGVTDPGHNHGITGVTANNGTTGPDNTGAADGMSFTAVTGISINSQTTGATVQNTTAGGTLSNTTATGTNASTTTGITTTNTGGGTSLSIRNPYAAVIFIIKT